MKKKYNDIVKNLYDYFPEFKKQLDLRIEKYYKKKNKKII